MSEGQKQWRAPRPTITVSPLDLAWVAGLAEGEGSFYLTSGRYPVPIFQLSMADEDVVRRAQDIMGVGSIRMKKPGPCSVKMQWQWRVAASAEVAWVMELLRPWLGQRRGDKVDELYARLPAWTGAGA